MKKLIILIGYSGSGKDSIANCLTFKYNLTQVKSYTTRKKRVNEGETHIFIDKKNINDYRKDMIAYTKIGEYEYFATINQVLNSDIYILDPEGYYNLKNTCNKLNIIIKLIPIYINVPIKIRYTRLEIRGDSDKSIGERFLNECEQFDKFLNKQNEYYYSIPNDDLEKTASMIYEIFKNEEN